MKESLYHKFVRFAFNHWPCIRGTGMKISYIANDWKEVRVKLPLSWRTRNYVGTIFGGSMYGTVDPFFMLMFIKILGPNYIVWDKAAEIDFKKPGTSTLYATFKLGDKEIEDVKKTLETERKLIRTYPIDLINDEGVVCASIQKTLYFRHKRKSKAP